MPKIILLSLSESARLFGVSQRTLRRAIADNDLVFTVVQGRYKLNFSDLLKWSQLSSRTRQKRDADGVGQYVAIWKTINPPEEAGANQAPVTAAVPAAQPLAFKRVRPKKVAPPTPQVTPDEPTLNWD